MRARKINWDWEEDEKKTSTKMFLPIISKWWACRSEKLRCTKRIELLVQRNAHLLAGKRWITRVRRVAWISLANLYSSQLWWQTSYSTSDIPRYTKFTSGVSTALNSTPVSYRVFRWAMVATKRVSTIQSIRQSVSRTYRARSTSLQTKSKQRTQFLSLDIQPISFFYLRTFDVPRDYVEN